MDDHRMFADALAQRLAEEPGVADVSVAATLDEAQTVARRHEPDVVLVDLDLAGEWGPDIIGRLGDSEHRQRFLVVSALHDPDVIARALASGADGYVEKGTGVAELLEAIHRALRGEMYLPAPLVRPVVSRLLSEHAAPAPDQTFLGTLTSREREVLDCLVAGLTRREVAEQLHISVATVRTHVQHLLQRAGVHSTLALVAAAAEAGLDETGTGSPT